MHARYMWYERANKAIEGVGCEDCDKKRKQSYNHLKLLMVDFFYPERNHSNLEDTFTLILSQARPGKDLKGCYIFSQ